MSKILPVTDKGDGGNYVYDLTFDMLGKVKDLPEKLLARDEGAIMTLMEALVGVGTAMGYVGNSRPASGSEHHLSHFFEITGLLENKEYFLHGFDRWDAIKDVLRETPSSAEMINYINRIGLDIMAFANHYGTEKIQNALWFAKDLKDRYSVLWLYFDLMYKAV